MCFVPGRSSRWWCDVDQSMGMPCQPSTRLHHTYYALYNVTVNYTTRWLPWWFTVSCCLWTGHLWWWLRLFFEFVWAAPSGTGTNSLSSLQTNWTVLITVNELYMNCTWTIHEPYKNCTKCYLRFLKEARAIFLLMIVQFMYSLGA